MIKAIGRFILPYCKGGDNLARPIKQGLDYFPLDVGFFEDIKVRRVKKDCGNQSIAILIAIFCIIYREEGYYVEINSDLSFLIAEMFGVSEDAVLKTVEKAVAVELFDSHMFNEYKILTSKGIQKRFFSAVSRRKEVFYDATFMLISENDYINLVNVYNNSINDNSNEQSKVKQSKVKQSKAVLEKPTAAAFTDEDDKDFEEVKNYFESYVKNDLSSMKDQVAITKALKEYPKDFIIQAMKSIVARGTNNIVSFTYFEPVLSSAWEEKNKPKSRQHVGKKNRKFTARDYDGIDFNKILEEKQRQMVEDAANG